MANSPSSDSMIDRIVRVLETFTADRSVQSASQIGRRAALPSSTAHRIVDELVDAGLLGRDEDRR
ncbi:helix-turn-helix domain-containing protein, partial [Enterococcus faecium]